MAECIFSSDINLQDIYNNDSQNYIFNLDDKNTFSKDLILIYMYFLPSFSAHGYKVGMAKCHRNETFKHALIRRISEQKHELALNDEQYEKYGNVREVIYWGVCLDAKNEIFKDYYVHKEIVEEYIGIGIKEQEWFINIPKDELINIFNNIRNKGKNKEIYTPRKEQRECIDTLLNYFKKNPTNSRFLLNCKMRFGKSYTTYKFCEEAKLKKILILTFVPAVESSWRDDLDHLSTSYKYLTDDSLKDPNFNFNDLNEPFVMFLSLQNLLGKDKDTNETKEKIKKLKDFIFDLVILDEYHFGAWNNRTQEKLEDINQEYQKELSKKQDFVKKFGIKTAKTICLSGTPFKAIAKGEFSDDNTFTYSYFDEQKNKYPNDDFKHPSKDYEQFPDMKIFGYNMSALFGNFTGDIFSEDKVLSKKYFSLNKFFETKKDSNENEKAEFVYEEEIKKWLSIIEGKSSFAMEFPYQNIDMIDNNKHTLWLMPSINACEAMAKLLNDDDYFRQYKIINLSSKDVGSGLDAYEFLKRNIKEANNNNKPGSIALTVNKLTLGVTVKEWSSVFVLKDLASPEQYFQSIFRIQTPFVEDGKILKTKGFVYDFNIDRAAALLLKYAEETNEKNVTKLEIAKLIIKYLPIFMNGDMNKPIEYQVFYQLAKLGDQSNVSLSKKMTDLEYTTRALDEETISQMLNDPEVNEIIKRVFAHAKFGKSKNRTIPPKPENDGYNTEEAKKGSDKGYSLGMNDSNIFINLDDNDVQEEFNNKIDEYIKEYCPTDYDKNKSMWFTNGFKKGYENGVNVPIRKLYCGKEDGKEFVKKIKIQFGENIVYTKETKSKIDDFIHKYLNDINNIPKEYRGMIYSRWYKDSFIKAIKDALRPYIKVDKDSNSLEDCDNVLKHILARLVEFLYISVYREETFQEIFKNANPNIFLEAVGIKKEDFEKLNKYHVFEEQTLNRYIHEFFINESLGLSKENNEQYQKQYRNSFNWFGYGISKKDE